WHLVADMERLRREVLEAEQMLVFGGSWGSTLRLAYAQKHTERVSELIVRGIFTARQPELLWFYQEGASKLLPDYWEHYLAPIPVAERGDRIAASRRRRTGTGRKVQLEAAQALAQGESRTITRVPNRAQRGEQSADGAAPAFSRIENHAALQRGFIEEGHLLR